MLLPAWTERSKKTVEFRVGGVAAILDFLREILYDLAGVFSTVNQGIVFDASKDFSSFK